MPYLLASHPAFNSSRYVVRATKKAPLSAIETGTRSPLGCVGSGRDERCNNWGGRGQGTAKLAVKCIFQFKITYHLSASTILFSSQITGNSINNFEYFTLTLLNPELNPIFYLLALLGAHHFLHVSRIRVKLLTFRLLMSYMEHPFLMFLDHTQRRSTAGRTPLDE